MMSKLCVSQRFGSGLTGILTIVAAIASFAAVDVRAAAPPSVGLASKGKALLPVVVSPDASDAAKASAAELAKYLGLISGAEFKVETDNGEAKGIIVGRAGDFEALPFEAKFGTSPFEREEYVLRSTPRALYVIGATDLAVSHAVWDALYRLGHRQFFPGDTWEVIPQSPELSIAVDERETPSFNARRIWYNWGLWGYNDVPYAEWCKRNRAVKGFDLQSGHAYESIISANKAEFDEHPEYLAQVNGKREMRGDAKFCISNPGLRKLVVEHAVRFFKENPSADSISMDPSDGGGWCECDACSAQFKSVSDRVVTLANAVAEAINDPALGLGEKYVGHYAYNQHSAPPSIKVHPNVMPSATTAFIGGGFTFDQVVDGWQKQGATMGVYDYFSVVDWDWNLPRGPKASRPKDVANFLAYIHGKQVRFFDAESGDCWGPAGLGYYVASRVMWDVSEAKNADAIIEDFLTKSFGDAVEPMRAFYQLITEDTQRRSPADIVGRMYRHLDAARKATKDPKVLKRIEDLILYTRHAELYYASANGGGSVDEVAKHAYRIRKTMMVHSYGLWSRLISQQAALTPDHPLKNEEPYTGEDVDKILADGIANNQPVDPGFEGVQFSKDLVPAAGPLKLPKVPAGNFPNESQDQQLYYIWLPENAGGIDLKIKVDKLWVNRQPKAMIYSPQEVSLNAVDTDESYKPDGKTYDVRLETPYAGLHKIETIDGGDYTRVEWPPGVPITIESGIDSPGVTSHFRGPWTMYFYVPKGTKVVGGWASRIANWAPRISGTLVDPDGNAVLDFGKLDGDGFFKVAVKSGQDGKLWKFENSQGQRLLMTVPPYLARSADELLLPKEVVEADAK